MKKASFHFLRVGMAIVFLWIGILIFKDPAGWGLYLQPWALALVPIPIAQAMIATAILDVIVGTLLLADIFTWLAAFIGALHILTVLITVGITDITIRDIGLLVGVIALMIESLPQYITRKFTFIKKPRIDQNPSL